MGISTTLRKHLERIVFGINVQYYDSMVQKHSNRLSWDGLEAIALVGQHGTVRSAADKIGVAHTTLAKRIASAELQLGIVAFVKGPKGYVATASGREIIAHAERMTHEARAIQKTVAGVDVELAGTVRISLLPSVLSEVLADRLNGFAAEHPLIQLEFITNDAFSDLDQNRADIAIRFQDNPSEHLHGRRVTTMCDAPYAALEVLRAYHQNKPAVPLIGWGAEKSVRERAKIHGIEDFDMKYVTADLASQADLAVAGLGIAILPCFVGDQRAKLVQIPASRSQKINDVWVLTHPDYKSSKRIQKVAQFCASTIKSKAHLFEGRSE